MSNPKTYPRIVLFLRLLLLCIGGGVWWNTAKNSVLPMRDAVPNLKWEGTAPMLIWLSEFIEKYPTAFMSLFFILLVIVMLPLITTPKKTLIFGKKTSFYISVFFIITIVFFVSFFTFGSIEMQNQMVQGMRLD